MLFAFRSSLFRRLKESLVSSEPEITPLPYVQSTRGLLPPLILLGSDGLFDFMTYEEVLTALGQALKAQGNSSGCEELKTEEERDLQLQAACENVVARCVERQRLPGKQAHDDISLVVLYLEQQRKMGY